MYNMYHNTLAKCSKTNHSPKHQFEKRLTLHKTSAWQSCKGHVTVMLGHSQVTITEELMRHTAM
jgi:hypothetical protein